MSAELYTDLTWLPRPPADFAAQCRGVFATEGSLGLADAPSKTLPLEVRHLGFDEVRHLGFELMAA